MSTANIVIEVKLVAVCEARKLQAIACVEFANHNLWTRGGRVDPRASFAGHGMDTAWDPLQRAYFSGYTMWTYLTTPFLLSMPGFEVTEIEPRREGDEVWRGLRAKFPSRLASHRAEQDFYFGD